MTASTEPPPHELDFLFHPRSIAIAGVSAKEDGGASVGFVGPLLEIGFRGPIFLVHPSATSIRGMKCYQSVLDIPDPVDYVISSVPARVVPALLEDCIAKGVRALHVFTAGFSETAIAERAELEDAVVRRAREAGIRLLGPNCMGIYSPSGRLAMSGGQSPDLGTIGMVSQSGANAMEFVRVGYSRGLRFSKVISFGNGADLDAAELLDYLEADSETEIVGAYLEGVQDGQHFARTLRSIAKAKPVVVLKGGRTDAGSRAANSHTGSLAGSFQVFDALCRQAGAIRADSMEALLDAVVAFRFVRDVPGPSVVVIGAGGGTSVLAADDLAAHGLVLPVLPAETRAALAQVTHEAGTSVSNPVDSAALWDVKSFGVTLDACAAASNIDVVLVHTTFGSVRPGRQGQPGRSAWMREQVERFARAREEYGKPVVVALGTATSVNGFDEILEFQQLCIEAGVATFPTIERAGRGIASLLARRRILGD